MSKNTFKIAVRKYEPLEAVVKIFWDKFRKMTDCSVDLEAVPMDLNTLYDTIFTGKGLINGEWDVAHLNTDWITGAKENGSLLDIAPFIENNPPEEYPDGWSPALLRLQTFGKNVYGFPFHDGPECFIYRKDLFNNPEENKRYEKEYDKELKVPETWDEFVETARFFNRPEKGLYGTVFAAYPDRHNNVFDFALQLWSRGGELIRNGRVILNSDQAEEAMIFYRRILNDTSVVYPKCRETDSIASGWLFAEGKIAMMVNWFGFAAMCETVPKSNVNGKVGITSIPRNKGCAPVSLSVYYTWSIGSGSYHKELAYEFIKFCVSKENDRLLPFEGAIGCRKSTWADNEINNIIPYYSELQAMHDYVKQFPKVGSWHDVTEVIDELVLRVVNTNSPVREILDEAQKKVEGMIIKEN
jgi:multiple sugar transport system substrate-binding protein